MSWACEECGYTAVKWMGSCPSCKNWNTFIEEIVQKKSNMAKGITGNKPVPIPYLKIRAFERIQSGIQEFDRLMGGGMVKGSLTLVAGSPGIGKSTLMLQLCQGWAEKGKKVLYICGEESAEQVSLRARRCGVNHENIYLFSETDLDTVFIHVQRLNPDLVIVDSVQIVCKTELPSAPGSVVQVRQVATEFMNMAKGKAITGLLIGHVTKSGEIAGPRVLEHIVDTVLEFEGDRNHGFRLLRSIKNRFGPTDDLALFQMKEQGLEQVLHPSEIFLEDRSMCVSGSCIVTGMEGVRAFLVEVQALVSSSAFSTPTRKAIGLDSNRLAVLLAVLEKRVGYQLHPFDIFLSVAGGIKMREPAVDLGVVLAIASSYSNRPIDSQLLTVGEIGLGGEVRPALRIESRLKEAIHMGMKTCILPRRNLKGLPGKYSQKLKLIPIDMIDEAIHELFS